MPIVSNRSPATIPVSKSKAIQAITKKISTVNPNPLRKSTQAQPTMKQQDHEDEKGQCNRQKSPLMGCHQQEGGHDGGNEFGTGIKG